ncbi:MAG: NADH-quinone oxidoreductase subunit J, partial [Phycisphaerae bacterium]
SLQDKLRVQRPLGLLAGLAFLLVIGFVVATAVVTSGTATTAGSLGDPHRIGEVLFTRYLYPFEITSVVLLAAMVGAVVLAKRE